MQGPVRCLLITVGRQKAVTIAAVGSTCCSRAARAGEPAATAPPDHRSLGGSARPGAALGIQWQHNGLGAQLGPMRLGRLASQPSALFFGRELSLATPLPRLLAGVGRLLLPSDWLAEHVPPVGLMVLQTCRPAHARWPGFISTMQWRLILPAPMSWAVSACRPGPTPPRVWRPGSRPRAHRAARSAPARISGFCWLCARRSTARCEVGHGAHRITAPTSASIRGEHPPPD